MKTRSTIIAVLTAASIFTLAIAAQAITTVNFKGGSGSGSSIGGTPDTGKYVIEGRAHIQFSDTAAKTSFSSDASKIMIQLYTSGAKASAKGLDNIKSTTFLGPVKIVYSTTANGVFNKTVATADSATFSGDDKLAHLKGNVRVQSEDPVHGSTVMTGDEATVNLNPNLGPDDFRFRVESSPGLSTIEVTPKAGEESRKK